MGAWKASPRCTIEGQFTRQPCTWLKPAVVGIETEAVLLMKRQFQLSGQPNESRTALGRSWGALKTVTIRMFVADLRSLATLRIILALIVLVNLANRATNLRAHYTDEGVLPRRVTVDGLSPWSWSLGFMNGSVEFQRLLFVVTAGAAIGLLLGYKTRWMTVIVWILISSIHVRNPLILSGGDLLLRLLLFWGMFVPLGATWSLDRWRTRTAPQFSMRFFSIGSMALFLQIAFMYWFTAALKTGPEWREDGSALFFVLRRPLYTTPIGEWLQQFPEFLRILSYGTMVVEIVAPILLFSPIWTGKLRMVAIPALIGLHVGIILTMSIGLFPWISSTSMLVFLPASFWEMVEPRVRAMSARWAGNLAGVRGAFEHSARGLAHEFQARVHLFSERPGLSLSTHPADPETEHGPRSPQLSTGNSTTSVDSGNKVEYPPDNRPGVSLRSPLWLNVVAACLLVFVFAWNMTTVSAFTLPSQSRPIAYSLNIQQNWVMFAPSPPRFNARYVLRGTLRNGQEVELLLPIVNQEMDSVQPFTWKQPDDLYPGYYRDMHWRLYLARLGQASREQRFAFASYVCRTWNDHYTNELEVESMVYVYVLEDIQPDGTPSDERTTGFGPYRCN
jgi:hypothetical protein